MINLVSGFESRVIFNRRCQTKIKNLILGPEDHVRLNRRCRAKIHKEKLKSSKNEKSSTQF